MKNVDRFSDRVENYVRYRPHYPQEVIQFLTQLVNFTSDWKIADIGAGTGISSELFLDHGNHVFAVEPNEPMRLWAEQYRLGMEKFTSVDGTAEATSLSEGCVDLIVAGQAFHWFVGDKARLEFQRIAKPGAYVLLMWNERDLASPLQQEYEQLLIDLAIDYTDVCQRNIDEDRISQFFGNQEIMKDSFSHAQSFDFSELKGRLLSSSYAPLPDHPNHLPIVDRLRSLFDQFQSDGQVSFDYLCKVYLGAI